ncbi:DUF262 domain-containing protein [Methanolobus sp. WCC5]|jgi:hypothetical protein|uniref:DUF262 domain-containing protein n=1 Tax=Methanolobus sp. WCC5 TaxID=3125785 RepID=UPI00324BF4D6
MIQQYFEEEIENLSDEDVAIVQKYQGTQKRLVTQKMDLYIPSLKDMLANNVINLEPKFQRRDRWNTKQQSKLIESIIMAIPIPPIFLAEEEYNSYSVMDGKQRLNAISSYIGDTYALTGLSFWSELNGKTFNQLNSTIQNAIYRRAISAVVILKESDLDIKFDVFERINTGGEHLNPQEIRNCIYRGSFNDLLIELSENRLFRKCLGLPNSQKEIEQTRIYKQMEDVQLVLRFFTLQKFEKISGNLKTSMNKYMEKSLKFTNVEMQSHRSLFIETIEKVHSVYADQAFRKWDPDDNKWSVLSAPVYDAVMYSFSKIDNKSIKGHESRIFNNTKKLFEDDDFLDSVRKGTNSLEANKTRMGKFLDMLRKSIE